MLLYFEEQFVVLFFRVYMCHMCRCFTSFTVGLRWITKSTFSPFKLSWDYWPDEIRLLFRTVLDSDSSKLGKLTWTCFFPFVQWRREGNKSLHALNVTLCEEYCCPAGWGGCSASPGVGSSPPPFLPAQVIQYILNFLCSSIYLFKYKYWNVTEKGQSFASCLQY